MKLENNLIKSKTNTIAMGYLICCYRPSDQKKGTSVKTLLRRTEKPSKKRKRIDDLVADALKREKREIRQKRKREKKSLRKQTGDSPKKDASDDNDGDVSIKQQTVINNDDVKQHAAEDVNVTPNTKQTESSGATSSDDSEVNNTKCHLPKTDDTDTNNTAEHETKEPDLRETSDHHNIENIPLIDTTIDDTQPPGAVIDYPQASVKYIENDIITHKKRMCRETTEETTGDDTTKNDVENLDVASLTTDEIEMLTTDSFEGSQSSTDQDCRRDQSTKIEDISKSDSKETYSEDSETNNGTIDSQDVKEVNTEGAKMIESKESTDKKEYLESHRSTIENNEDIHNTTTDVTEVNEKNVDISETKESIDNEVTIDDQQLDSHRTTTDHNDDIHNATLNSQYVAEVSDKDVEISETKEITNGEQLHSRRTTTDDNEDIHNTTTDVTEVNEKHVDISETKGSIDNDVTIDNQQLDSHRTTKDHNEDIHTATIDSQDVTEVNDEYVEISETKISIYDENRDSPRTSTEENSELEWLTVDRTAGNIENTYNEEHIKASDTCKDASEIVHNDNSLPSEEEKTDETEECEDSKYTRNTIETIDDKGRGETNLDYNPEDDKATTYENEVPCCESNLVNDGEHADVSTRTKENEKKSMGQNDSFIVECVSNGLSAERGGITDSKQDPLEIVDVNIKQDHEIFPDTDDKDGLKASENEHSEYSVHNVTSDVEQSDTAITRSDTNKCQACNIGDTSNDAHDCKDKLEQMPHDVETVSDSERAELFHRARSMPIRKCVALVTGFAKELKQANVIPKQRNKFVVSKTERYLDKTKSIILKRPMPKSAVLNRVKSWHRRRTPVQKRVYPGALDTMIRIGQKPQLKAIERLKKDSMNYEKRRKLLTEQDRHGSIEELKWSRHMRTGVRLKVRREKAAIENEKYKMIASIANGRYNRYNHLPPVVKHTPTSMPFHSLSTSHIKPATIQTIRERYGLGKNQSSSRCVSPNRSNSDSRYSSLSRTSSTYDINHRTESSSESQKKIALRRIMRQFEKACKDVEILKSSGTERAVTPSRHNTSYVGIGRQTSFTNLGMDRCRKDF